MNPTLNELAIDVLSQALRPLGAVATRVRIDLEAMDLPIVFTPGPPGPPPPVDPLVREIARAHPLDPLGGLGPQQLAASILGAALSERGTVQVNKRIEPEPGEHLTLSVWFKPGPPPGPLPGHLKMLADMGRLPAAFEIPDGIVGEGVYRHLHWIQLEWGHRLSQRGEEVDDTQCLPPLWIICQDATAELLDEGFFGLRPKEGWPPGVYEGMRAMRHGLVALSRLPLCRETALLHLLGSEAQRRRARAWVCELPEDDADRAALLALASAFAS